MSTITELKIPDIGNYTDVDVIEVLIKPGDRIVVDQALLTLETDKAAMEIPSTAAGTIKEVKVTVGSKVSEGDVVALLEHHEETTREPSITTVIGVETTVESAEKSCLPATQTSAVSFENVHASPSVRRFAREQHVDLNGVVGTGPKGRILEDDVRAFIEKTSIPPETSNTTKTSETTHTGLDLLAWPKTDFSKWGPIEAQPLSRIKKLSGANLHRNWVMIPHVTLNDEADMTELEQFRKQINQEWEGMKVSPLSFIIKALAETLKTFPEFNASLDGDHLILKKYYHIGFAADTPQGLLVPVIKDVDQKGIKEISQALGKLSGLAREGKLKPCDMQGATFTVSSLGGIGGVNFTPIINAPEVAILGVCQSRIKPVWNGKEFQPRLMCPLSLSFDHRVIDGAAAARFIRHLIQLLGDLRRLIL